MLHQRVLLALAFLMHDLHQYPAPVSLLRSWLNSFCVPTHTRKGSPVERTRKGIRSTPVYFYPSNFGTGSWSSTKDRRRNIESLTPRDANPAAMPPSCRTLCTCIEPMLCCPQSSIVSHHFVERVNREQGGRGCGTTNSDTLGCVAEPATR